MLLSSLCPRRFSANDIVSLDYGGDAHPDRAIIHPPLDSNDFSKRTHKNFRAMRNLRRKCQSNIQLRARLEILLDHKI